MVKLVRDKSSKVSGRFIGVGIGRGTLKGVVPDVPERKHRSAGKDVSKFGKAKRGRKTKTLNVKASGYTDPKSHMSVGGQLLKEDNKHLDQDRTLKRKGKKTVKHPERMGKETEAGLSVPTKRFSKTK